MDSTKNGKNDLVMDNENADMPCRSVDSAPEQNGTEQCDHGRAEPEAPLKHDRRQKELETLIRRVYEELTVQRQFSGRLTSPPQGSATTMAIGRLREAAQMLEECHPQEARAVREIIAT